MWDLSHGEKNKGSIVGVLESTRIGIEPSFVENSRSIGEPSLCQVCLLIVT